MPTVVVLALTLALAPAPSPSATSNPLGDIVGGVGQIVDDLLGGDTPSAAPAPSATPTGGGHAESATGRRSAQPGGTHRDPRARRARRAVSPHPPPPIAAPLARTPAPARPPCPGATATPPRRPPPPALANPTRECLATRVVPAGGGGPRGAGTAAPAPPGPGPRRRTPTPVPPPGSGPATGPRPGAGQRQPIADQPQRHLRDGPAGRATRTGAPPANLRARRPVSAMPNRRPHAGGSRRRTPRPARCSGPCPSGTARRSRCSRAGPASAAASPAPAGPARGTARGRTRVCAPPRG